MGRDRLTYDIQRMLASDGALRQAAQRHYVDRQIEYYEDDGDGSDFSDF